MRPATLFSREADLLSKTKSSAATLNVTFFTYLSASNLCRVSSNIVSILAPECYGVYQLTETRQYSNIKQSLLYLRACDTLHQVTDFSPGGCKWSARSQLNYHNVVCRCVVMTTRIRSRAFTIVPQWCPHPPASGGIVIIIHYIFVILSYKKNVFKRQVNIG